jgi:uncharacterized protein YlzI (FlbEa/FlbD family)
MMIQFTQPKGDPVWINLEQIEKFQESHNNDGTAICLISGHIQIVLELPKTVVEIFRDAKRGRTATPAKQEDTP